MKKIYYQKNGILLITPCPTGKASLREGVRVGSIICMECKDHHFKNGEDQYVICKAGKK
ncbi:hypothetical protein ACFL2R_02015 [Patescibacteria group bacterium]